MRKSFEQLVREKPDAFDAQDARSGPSAYPPESVAAATPAHIAQAIERRRKNTEKPRPSQP